MREQTRIARTGVVAVTILFGACLALPAGVGAQTSPSDWQFGATLYLWGPSIGGTSKFPADSGGSSVEISLETLLKNLNLAFMGTFEASKGRWGGFTDVIYLDCSGNGSRSRDVSIGGVELPASVTAGLGLDLTGWAWTLAGTYRAVDGSGSKLDLVAGARMLDIKEQVDWQLTGELGSLPPESRSGSHSASISDLDAIVGVKGRFCLGTKRAWVVPYYLDLGAGESNLTWQGLVGLGYAFNWGQVTAAWRYLDYDLPSDQAITGVDFNGPEIAVTFRW